MSKRKRAVPQPTRRLPLPTAPITVASAADPASLRKLDADLVAAWSAADKEATGVCSLIVDVIRTRTFKVLGFQRLPDYLIDRLKVSRRSAQQLALVARFYVRLSLPKQTIVSFPTSAAREIAAYATRAKLERSTVTELIARFQQEDWTVEQFRQHLQSLSGKLPAPKPKRRSVRIPEPEWDRVQQSSRALKELTDSDDLATNVVWAMTEVASTVMSDTAGSPPATRTVIAVATRHLERLNGLALQAQAAKKQAQANRIWSQLAYDSFLLALLAGRYVSPDSDAGDALAVEAFKQLGEEPDHDAVRRSGKAWMMLWGQLLGIPDDSMERLLAELDADAPHEKSAAASAERTALSLVAATSR